MFTYDPENFPDLPKLVNTLRTQNRQFFTILDPVVAVNSSLIQEVQDQFPGYDMLESGNQADIWVKDAANDTLLGEVWAGPSAFPDFTNPASQSWWSRWINFYRALSAGTGTMDVRALWLDMSEPSSFTPGVCGKNQWNYPPYVPHVAGAEKDGSLLSKTLCMDAQLHWGRHYDVHSL
ncbi:sucrase-isomaltase, intestinal, partial [Aplysia californica]|uniref:Sucrase-isomaltase, intestinal n=1 Tax=Aplysia californica TaxID=6500 RepID=A0ABM1A0U7_APLCA